MDRMTKLSEAIRSLMEGEFSGSIKINFTQGSLGRIEKSEELEDAAILLAERDKGKTRGIASYETLKALPVMLLLSVAFGGCAASGLVRHAQPASDIQNIRIVRPGDVADIRYLCRLKSGEIAAATDPAAESGPKSDLYVPRQDAGALPLTVMDAADASRVQGPYEQRTLEDEILYRLSPAIVGMKEGSRSTAEIKAEDAPASEASKYIARLTRVRTRPKIMKMPKGDYIYLTHGTSPEVGQHYTYDPDFPGTVESVSDKDVTIRLSATPGAVLSTPFGPGRVREEGADYKVDIDAHKGALVRAAGMTGRITDVDDKVITVDFGNAFGGETLLCDVTVEKITDEKLVKNESGGR